MVGCNFPITLVNELYSKLSKAISDNGEYLEIVDNEEAGTFQVSAKKDIPE